MHTHHDLRIYHSTMALVSPRPASLEACRGMPRMNHSKPKPLRFHNGSSATAAPPRSPQQAKHRLNGLRLDCAGLILKGPCFYIGRNPLRPLWATTRALKVYMSRSTAGSRPSGTVGKTPTSSFPALHFPISTWVLVPICLRIVIPVLGLRHVTVKKAPCIEGAFAEVHLV